jgi:hypothetical protein
VIASGWQQLITDRSRLRAIGGEFTRRDQVSHCFVKFIERKVSIDGWWLMPQAIFCFDSVAWMIQLS